MGRRHTRVVTTILALAVAALALSLAAVLVLRQGLVDHAALRRLAGLAPALAGTTVVLTLVYATFAVLAKRILRRQPTASLRNLGSIESALAVLVALFFVAATFAGFGNALLSLSLVGFALTLALQRPILAMAGWAAIRFGRLFREGDRIEIQGIVGDVLHVTLFRTQLWEIGSDKSPLPWGGTIAPLRETGRLVTLSNATFLEHPIANATADTPVVFDEFTVGVAYEADWELGERLLREAGNKVIDPHAHALAAARYERLVADLPATAEFPREPTVILVPRDSWIEIRLRYLVDVRRRSATRSRLTRAWLEATREHAEKLPNVYPRVQSQRIGGSGRATE